MNCTQINPTAASKSFKPSFKIDRSTCTRPSFYENIKEIRAFSENKKIFKFFISISDCYSTFLNVYRGRFIIEFEWLSKYSLLSVLYPIKKLSIPEMTKFCRRGNNRVCALKCIETRKIILPVYGSRVWKEEFVKRFDKKAC